MSKTNKELLRNVSLGNVPDARAIVNGYVDRLCRAYPNEREDFIEEGNVLIAALEEGLIPAVLRTPVSSLQPTPAIGEKAAGMIVAPQWPAGTCLACAYIVNVETGAGHGPRCEL